MLFSESLAQVIDLAHLVRAYYERELPRSYRDYPLVHPDEQQPPVPSVERELIAYLNSLPSEDVTALATLQRFGRSALRREDLSTSLQATRDLSAGSDQILLDLVRYLPLGSVLARARGALLNLGVDVDEWLSTVRTTAAEPNLVHANGGK